MTATMPVGSGDWLGCVLVMLIIMLIIELTVLAVLYKQKREYNQNRRKSNERPSQTNQQTGLPLQSPARNLGKLGCSSGNLGLPMCDSDGSLKVRVRATVGKCLAMPLNQILKLLRCHKSINVAKQPNEQKLSHAAGDSRQPETRSEN